MIGNKIFENYAKILIDIYTKTDRLQLEIKKNFKTKTK